MAWLSWTILTAAGMISALGPGKYFQLHVVNAPAHIQRAKKLDLEKFLNFYVSVLNSAIPDLWTPAITKAFQTHLAQQISHKTR